MFPMLLQEGVTVPSVPGGGGSDIGSAIGTVVDQLEGSINTGVLLEVVGACIGVSVVFFLLYWGGRKVIRAISGGIKKGRLKGF